jgi:hypothetical protein
MNENEFPRMVYQAGGHEEIHGGKFSTHIVHGAGRRLVADHARSARSDQAESARSRR